MLCGIDGIGFKAEVQAAVQWKGQNLVVERRDFFLGEDLDSAQDWQSDPNSPGHIISRMNEGTRHVHPLFGMQSEQTPLARDRTAGPECHLMLATSPYYHLPFASKDHDLGKRCVKIV